MFLSHTSLCGRAPRFDRSHLDVMLLRTAALLLLCSSLGTCATLGYYQADAEEEGAAADGAAEHLAAAETLPVDNQRADRAAEEARVEHPPPTDQDNDINPIQTNKPPKRPAAQEEESSWSLNSIRNSFQTVHGYFDSLVELVGGHNGVCRYRCRYGENKFFSFKLPYLFS